MEPMRFRLRFLVDVDRLNESLNVHGGTVDVFEFGSLESGQLGMEGRLTFGRVTVPKLRLVTI
jgi:hypothetical protein